MCDIVGTFGSGPLQCANPRELIRANDCMTTRADDSGMNWNPNGIKIASTNPAAVSLDPIDCHAECEADFPHRTDCRWPRRASPPVGEPMVRQLVGIQ